MTRNIKLPPRVQQQLIDTEAYKYPLIRRLSGDSRFGIASSTFDDCRTVVFDTQLLNYPTALPSGSRYIGNQQTTSDIEPSFHSVPGSVKMGVVDDLLSVQTTSSLAPYVEAGNHHFVVNDDPFYATGSAIEDVGFGFTSPLRSKATIVIDLEPKIENMYGQYATYAEDQPYDEFNVSDTGSFPMQYFNHELKQWEGIGRGMRLYRENDYDLLNTFCMGFGQGDGFFHSFKTQTEVNKNRAIQHGCMASTPIINYGFPCDPRYHATSSQIFSLSDKISKPFVLEKVVYEFSATLDGREIDYRDVGDWTKYINTYEFATPITTFFILNQRSNTSFVADHVYYSPGYETLYYKPEVPLSLPLTTRSLTETFVDATRDLVTYLQISSIGSGISSLDESQHIKNALKRELTIMRELDGVDIHYLAGEYVLSGSCKISATVTSSINTQLVRNIRENNKYGTRTGLKNTSGRSLTSEFGQYANQSSAFVSRSVSEVTYSSHSYANPYILLPTDKLVFGWQLPTFHYISNYSNLTDPMFTFTIHPGKGRCILYGSLLQEGHEFHDTLNQELTTEQVHEAICTEPVLDQLITAPQFFWSGSYLAEYITGSMSTASGLSRSVVISNVSMSIARLGDMFDDLGLVDDPKRFVPEIKGFQRFVQLTDEKERFYDTMPPAYDKVSVRDGSPIYTYFDEWDDSINVYVIGAVPTGSSGQVYALKPNASWLRAFPFEPRYSDIIRSTVAPVKSTSTMLFDYLGNVTNDARRRTANTTVLYSLVHSQSIGSGSSSSNDIPPRGTTIGPPGMWLWGNTLFQVSSVPERYMLLSLYGIGDFHIMNVCGPNSHLVTGSVGMFPKPRARVGVANLGISVGHDRTAPYITSTSPEIRGFKYGLLNAVPQYSRAIYRHDRYGQMRDMLEQRLDGKFFVDGKTTDSPVKAFFVKPQSDSTSGGTTSVVTLPRLTWCSNLSNEATSSMPYFDWQVKNREEPLNTTDINSSMVSIGGIGALIS
jgi:hypothetical protein